MGSRDESASARVPRGVACGGAAYGLFGRDAELARLDTFLAEVRGGGGILSVLGASGSGRSTIIEALCERAYESRIQVLRAVGCREEREIPYAVLNQLVLSVQPVIEHLSAGFSDCLADVAGLRVTELTTAPSRVTDAATALLGTLTAASPVLIVVDDANWTDRQSWEVLADMARRFRGGGVGFAASLPPNAPAWPDPHGSARSIELKPLSTDAALALVEARLPDLGPREREELAESARGNPRRLLEAPVESDSWPPVSAWRAAVGWNEEMLEREARSRLAAGDPDRAVRLLVQAAESSRDPAARVRRLALAAFACADGCGRIGEAEQILAMCRQSDGLPTPPLAVAAWTFLLMNTDSDVESAHRLLADTLEKGSSAAADRNDIEDALQCLLLLTWMSGREDLWGRYRAVQEAVLPDPPDVLRVTVGAYTDPAGMLAKTRTSVDTLFSSLGEDADQVVRAGIAAMPLDRLGMVRQGSWRQIERGRRGGSIRRHVSALAHLCFDGFLTGRWDEVRELAEEGSAVCRGSGLEFLTWTFHYSLACVAAGSGQYARSAELTDEIVRWAGPRGARVAQGFACHARTIAAMGRRRFEDAFSHATAIGPAGTLNPVLPQSSWIMYDLVDAAVRTGRMDEARQHVRAMRAARVGEVSARQAALLSAACALVSDRDRAGEEFSAALAVPGLERWAYDTARIRLAYGEWLRRGRQTTPARAELKAARAAFQAMGAAPWVDRADQELNATGLGVARNSPQSGALTAQERQIAQLAASGLTNRQIAAQLGLSPYTVGSHLYRVFPKLEINSRAALRDALAC